MAPRSLSQDQRLPHQRRTPEFHLTQSSKIDPKTASRKRRRCVSQRQKV